MTDAPGEPLAGAVVTLGNDRAWAGKALPRGKLMIRAQTLAATSLQIVNQCERLCAETAQNITPHSSLAS